MTTPDQAHVLDVGARHRERGRSSSRRSTPRSTSRSRTSARASPHYQKLRSAIEAGEGAPDVAQIEYQYIPSFVLPEVAARPHAVRRRRPLGRLRGLGRGTRSSPDEQVWAIPQDVGPMGNLYREDILTQAGITEPPATWDEYADRGEGREGCDGLVHLEPRRHPGRPDDRASSGRPASSRSATTARRPSASTSTATRPRRSRRTGPT